MSVGTFRLNGSTTTVKVYPLTSGFGTMGVPQTYQLLHYTTKTGTTTWATANTTRNVMGDPVDTLNTHIVDLTITPAAAHDLTWTSGTGDNAAVLTWDWANPTVNAWTSSSPDKYYDLDTVTFGTYTNAGVPTASFVKLVTPGCGFIPGAVTVNSDSDYTFTASTAEATGSAAAPPLPRTAPAR